MRFSAYDNMMVIAKRGAPPEGFIQIPEGTGKWWAAMGIEASALCLANARYLIGKYDEMRRDLTHPLPVEKLSWSKVPHRDTYLSTAELEPK